MNDYYIGVDQNGQPYISHANPLQAATASVRSAGAGLGRGVRRYHKYLMKIGEGTKARYLYTQQEVQAYMRGGRKALDQMAKNTKENARKGLTTASDKIGVKARKDLKEKTAAAKEPNVKIFKGVDRNGIHTGIRPKDAIRRNREISEAVTAKKNYDKTLLGKAENTVKSTSDHMKEEFRKKKDEVASGVNSVKSKAKESVNKTSQAMRSKAQDAEDSINSARDKAKGAFDEGKSRVKDSVKSTSDRMKEEFRKKKDETKEKASNTVNKVKKNLSNEPPKPVLSPAGKEHIETERIIPEKKIEETRIPEKRIEETRIPEKRVNAAKTVPNSKAKYSEYKDDDPDFDENNYSENDRVGDTDFFAFKGADGRTVIIEEDMKWTLPKGVEPDDPAIKEAINKFADEVTSARSLNMGNYTGDQWTKGATDAINDAIEKAQKKNKKS